MMLKSSCYCHYIKTNKLNQTRKCTHKQANTENSGREFTMTSIFPNIHNW